MKLKLKKSPVAVKAPYEVDETQGVEEAICTFNRVISDIENDLVERSEEVLVLKLCLIAKQHLLLKGSHGVAKSMLAKSAFSRITGSNTFFHQFSKTSQADQVLGCMETKSYREKAVWTHNTTKMLPEAHFGFLDELFRASNGLLPTCMGILNEREFINGTDLMQCPLITAIGTCNFITEDEELAAFTDRFLARMEVKPLSNNEARIRAVTQFLEREGSKVLPKKEHVSLAELVQVQEFAKSVKIPDYVLDLYIRVVDEFKRACPSADVSDRRLCLGIKFIQASYALNESRPAKLNEGYIAAAQYAICNNVKPSEVSMFVDKYDTIIGQHIQEVRVNTGMEKLRDKVLQLESEIDSKMDLDDAMLAFKQVSRFSGALEDPSIQNLSTPHFQLATELKRKLDAMDVTLMPLVRQALENNQ